MEILFLILIIAVLIFIRPITTLFHELGHAIPALLFSEETVSVYVGSYGDVSKSFRFQIGRFILYFRYKIVGWDIGLCSWKPSSTVTFIQQILITFGGPFASLVLGITSYFLLQRFEGNDMLVFALAAIMVSAILDFFVNIIPNKTPAVLHDGSVVYNDGAYIQHLFSSTKYPEEFKQGLICFQQSKYKKAIEYFEDCLDQNFKTKEIYSSIIHALVADENHLEALRYFHVFREHFNLETFDYVLLADVYKELGYSQKAIISYSEALYKDFMNADLYNRRGLVHLGLGNYNAALADFNKAVNLDNTDKAFLTNRTKALAASSN